MLKMKLIASVMLIVLTTALIGGLTGAWFTDADNAGTATFTAGTLSVDVSDGLTAFNVLDTAKLAAMEPGDVFSPVKIEIINDGTKNLAWFGDWTVAAQDPIKDALLDKLYIKSMRMEFLKADGTPWSSDPWYSGYEFIVDGKGNLLAHNAGEDAFYDGLAALSPDNVITLRNWINNANMAPGTIYEHMGALKPTLGNKYVITVVFGFLGSAGNEYQANAPYISPITVGFNVNATQVNKDAINALNSSYPTLGNLYYGHLYNQITAQP